MFKGYKLFCCMGFGFLAFNGTLQAQNPAPVKPAATASAVAPQEKQTVTEQPTAQKYTCTKDAITRRIEVSAADPAEPKSCHVNYFKDTEQPGVAQTLWDAKHDQQFCVQKAAEFVKKLEALGYSCK